MESTLFWENNDKSVIINETPIALILTLDPKVNEIYEAYFKNVGLHSNVGNKNIWTFNKSNSNAIDMVGKMIGNSNIRASFKFTEPISEFILKVLWKSQDEKSVIVEYTASSIVLFCDKDFGQKNSERFKQVKGKFNMNLKHKADGSITGPGWLFWKEPEVFNLFQEITGVDLRTMVIPPPAKKAWKGGNTNSNYNLPFKTENVSIPTTQPLSTGLSNFNGPTIKKNVTPAINLSSLLDSLSIPMERVQRTTDQELVDFNGDIRIGMWGPSNKLDDEISAYKEQYGDDRVKENVRFSINNNTVVILTRKID